EAAVHQVFSDFAAQIRPDGALIVCAEDPGATALGQRYRDATTTGTRVYTYGLLTSMNPAERHNTHEQQLDLAIIDIQPDDAETGQHVTYRFADGSYQEVHLATPGIHNALNAAGVLLAAVVAGMSADEAAKGLSAFTGSARRFEHHGTVKIGRASCRARVPMTGGRAGARRG